jgi:hypothetical protein
LVKSSTTCQPTTCLLARLNINSCAFMHSAKRRGWGGKS